MRNLWVAPLLPLMVVNEILTAIAKDWSGIFPHRTVRLGQGQDKSPVGHTSGTFDGAFQ